MARVSRHPLCICWNKDVDGGPGFRRIKKHPEIEDSALTVQRKKSDGIMRSDLWNQTKKRYKGKLSMVAEIIAPDQNIVEREFNCVPWSNYV